MVRSVAGLNISRRVKREARLAMSQPQSSIKSKERQRITGEMGRGETRKKERTEIRKRNPRQRVKGKRMAE